MEAAVLDLLAVVDDRRWYVVPAPERPFAEAGEHDPRRLRIGVFRRPGFPVSVEDEALAAVGGAADLLSNLGHEELRFSER